MDASYITAGGEAFSGIDDYRRLLLRERKPVLRNLASQLVVYATGAEVGFADRDWLATLPNEPTLGFRSLIEAVVESPLFLEQ